MNGSKFNNNFRILIYSITNKSCKENHYHLLKLLKNPRWKTKKQNKENKNKLCLRKTKSIIYPSYPPLNKNNNSNYKTKLSRNKLI